MKKLFLYICGKEENGFGAPETFGIILNSYISHFTKQKLFLYIYGKEENGFGAPETFGIILK